MSGNRPHILSAAYFWLLMLPAFAADQGVIRGVVHDPAHRPIAGAQVVASTAEPARSESLATNADGGFQFDNLAEGTWTVAVSAPGFQRLEQSVTVAAGRSPVLHLAMEVAGVNEVITVSSAADRLNAQTATPRVLVEAEDVVRTPGADQTNSLAMITDFTPGAYMVHDMLHEMCIRDRCCARHTKFRAARYRLPSSSLSSHPICFRMSGFTHLR